MLKHCRGSDICLPNFAFLLWTLGLAGDPEQRPCRLL